MYDFFLLNFGLWYLLLFLDLLTPIWLLLLNLFYTLVAVSNIFSDEEGGLFLLLGHLLVSCCWIDKPHLWMSRRCEDFLSLCFFSELSRENLTFNVSVRPNVGNLEWDSLTHNFSVQIVALYFLLDFSWKELDWIGIGPLTGLVGLSLLVSFIINQVLVIYHNGRKVLLQFEFQVRVVWCSSRCYSKWISCNVYNINALCHSKEPDVSFWVYNVEWKI